MEHAIRHHITVRLREDPVRYQKLSDRLESILADLDENWEATLTALRELTDDIRETEAEDEAGETEHLPFLNLLIEEVGEDVDTDGLEALTHEMLEYIRQEIKTIDFWRNTYAQNLLRSWLVGLLDAHDILPFDRLEEVTDRIFDLVEARKVSLSR